VQLHKSKERMVQARELSNWQIASPLFLVWAATVAISLFMHRDDIATLQFGDPDDTMRLLQVRDFLAGQNWFDVSQHRVNPPFGGPMHWSRLVDLPIAGAILLLRPFFGAHGAEIGAIIIVPALTLAVLLCVLYWAVCPLMSQGRALLCCAAFAISPFIFVQCGAMRIDHHAWQAVMMALALGGTLHSDIRKGGVIAGLAMAVWLQISIEGLAFAALTGTVMTVRYTLNQREWSRLASYLWTLVGSSTVLLIGTQGWSAAQVVHCDSISPVYLAPLAVLPPLMTILHWMFEQSTPLRRFLAIALAAGASMAIFLGAGEQCLAGPFGMLDPVVYKFWYLGISEGLPIWRQNADIAIIIVLPSLIGLIGYAIAAYEEQTRLRKLDWLTLFIFSAGATILALFVMRTGFIAHLLAIPGAAWLTAVSFKRARASSTALLRIPATIVAVMLLFPIVVIPIKSAAFSAEGAKNMEMATTLNPVEVDEITALERLAPTTVLAPIDISPGIMLRTRNSVIGTAHHRNTQGMKLVFDTFLASQEDAREIVLRSSAMYLVFAPMGETERYREFAPRGLAAVLRDGKCPDWLSPVPLPGLKKLRLYRIARPSAAAAIRSKTIPQERLQPLVPATVGQGKPRKS
jgi:uncharacterized membrane protein